MTLPRHLPSARPRPLFAAWLSLDTGDNDPARFWRHVVAALDRAAPGPATGRPAARAARGAANRTEAVARARELNLIP